MSQLQHLKLPISVNQFISELNSCRNRERTGVRKNRVWPWHLTPEYQPTNDFESFIWQYTLGLTNEEQNIEDDYNSIFEGYSCLRKIITTKEVPLSFSSALLPEDKIDFKYGIDRQFEITSRDQIYNALAYIFLRLLVYSFPDPESELIKIYSKDDHGKFSVADCYLLEIIKKSTHYVFNIDNEIPENLFNSPPPFKLIEEISKYNLPSAIYISDREIALNALTCSGSSASNKSTTIQKMKDKINNNSIAYTRNHSSECISAMEHAIDQLWEDQPPPKSNYVRAWLKENYPAFSDREVAAIDSVMRPESLKGKRKYP